MVIKNTGFDVNAAQGGYSVRKTENPGTAHKADSSSSSTSFSHALQQNVDRIELSFQPVKAPSPLTQAKKGVVSALQADAQPERLAHLKEQVRTGQYTVDSAELARILISVNR